MVGHVNMMDDVLISNLPPEYLRSALRTLLSRGAVNQQIFTQHIQSQHIEAGLRFTKPLLLFPDADAVSEPCLDYISRTRCLFSAQLAWHSISYLSHFVQSMVIARASWSPGSSLAHVLDQFSGDVVQAIQALKEGHPTRTIVLKIILKELLISLADCRKYCTTFRLPFPFQRPQRQVQDALVYFFPQEVDNPLVKVERGTQGSVQLYLQESSSVETVQLGPYQMPRLFNGLWQLSSPAWGAGNSDEQEKYLVHLVESGLVATDMADHYGDAELVYGDFRSKLSSEVADKVFAVTKWCVFKPIEQEVTTEWVLEQVQERSRRLGGRVELLQLEWYDYNDKKYLDILVELVGITKTHPELVSAIGLCNFDADHIDEVCEYIKYKTGEVGIVSNQVQFSLLDTRPLKKMIPICEKHNLKLLTYGSFCGGFLSETWLTQPAPDLYSPSRRLTPSQRKYLEVIRSWGPWYDFQCLLGVLFSIAAKHGVAIPNVATRWVLQQPCVASVIIGTTLGASTTSAAAASPNGASQPPGSPPLGGGSTSPSSHRSSPPSKNRNSVSISNHRNSLSFSSNKRASWNLNKRYSSSFNFAQPPMKTRATENLRVFGWELDEEDMAMINAAALGKDGERTEALFAKMGDCGDEYRMMD